MPPRSPVDYHVLAEARGFTWLGSEVRNVMVKTGWRCDPGHQWQTPYRNLQQGSGCPHCNRGRRRGRQEKRHVEEIKTPE